MDLLRSIPTLCSKKPLEPLELPYRDPETGVNASFEEEDQLDGFRDGQYYPIRVGEVYLRKYQVLGKLGYGVTSAVWLARNLVDHSYVVLKVFTRDASKSIDEFQTYEAVDWANRQPKGVWRHLRNALDIVLLRRHDGHKHVRTAIDMVTLHRIDPNGQRVHYNCLVQKPMWDSWLGLLRRQPGGRFDVAQLKDRLKQLFLALDYLHSECGIVHTDISPQNIMVEVRDESIFDAFTAEQLAMPGPWKLVHPLRPVYASLDFHQPSALGNSVLGDFGSAVSGTSMHTHIAQPDVYRAPEVMLRADWSYPVDIWNVGCMVFDLYLGRHLFNGLTPTRIGYSTGAHLAEIVGFLGNPPLELIDRGYRSSEFFTQDGRWKSHIPIPIRVLDRAIEGIDEAEEDGFVEFITGMLQWRPEDRKTAKELYKDAWLWK